MGALSLTLMVPGFRRNRPSISAISPAIGFDSVTNLSVTITGRNLDRLGLVITVGGEALTSFSAAADGKSATAELDVSAISAGAVDVIAKVNGLTTSTVIGGFTVLADQIETMIGDFTYLRNGNVVTTATPSSGLINMAGGSGDGQQDGIISDQHVILATEAGTAIYDMGAVAIPGEGDYAQLGFSNNAVVADGHASQNGMHMAMAKTAAGNRIITRTVIGGSFVEVANTASPGGITPTHYKITKTTGNIYTTYYSQDEMATWTQHATGIDMSSVTDDFYLFMEGYGVNGSLDFSLTAVNLEVA